MTPHDSPQLSTTPYNSPHCPTTPPNAGKFIGGLDTVKQLREEGTLYTTIHPPAEPVKTASAVAGAGGGVGGPVGAETGINADGSLSALLQGRLRALVKGAPVMLFMKGSPDAPECGYVGD